MVTVKDLFEISGNKMVNDVLKSIARSNFQPHAAEGMCTVIDGYERADHFMRFVKEYNEWMMYQQRQQLFIWQHLLSRG